MNAFSSIGTGGDIDRGEAGISSAIVLVPGNGVVILRGRDDVEIPIAIHVGDMNAVSSIGTGRDIGGAPAWVRGAVVLKPGNGVVGGRG